MTTQISTQSQLSTFNFETQQIRVIAVNGEPWFIVKDICEALNLSNPTMAIANLDEDEKMVVGLNDTPDPKLNLGSKEKGVTSTYTPNLKLGSAGNGAQSLSLVSESGMYTLILRCREAVKKGSVPHRFRKWVTAEVLPQIRKTGQYSQNNQQIAPLAIEHKIEQPQPLSDSELYTLAKVWREVETMRYWLNALQEPLKWLKSPYVDDVLEAQTFRSDIEDFRNIVIKYSGHIQKSSSPNTTITPFQQAILDLRKKWLRLNTGREIIQPIF